MAPFSSYPVCLYTFLHSCDCSRATTTLLFWERNEFIILTSQLSVKGPHNLLFLLPQISSAIMHNIDNSEVYLHVTSILQIILQRKYE